MEKKKKSMYEVTIYVSDDDVPPQKLNFFLSYLSITLASVVLVNTCILMPFLNGVTSFTLWNLLLCVLMTALIVHQIYTVHTLKKRHKTNIEWYAMSKAILAFSEQFESQQQKIHELRKDYEMMNQKQDEGESHEHEPKDFS